MRRFSSAAAKKSSRRSKPWTHYAARGPRRHASCLCLGASGSGKSSLVRAGVIPRLKKTPAEWLPAPPFRPQLEPLDELAMALATAFETHGRPRDWNAIRTDLHTAASRNPVDGLVLLGLARDWRLPPDSPKPRCCSRSIRRKNCSATHPRRRPRAFCACCGPRSKRQTSG